jgi:hypothetical protein
MLLYYFLTWLIGAMLFYSLDGLFDYFDETHNHKAAVICMLWPITILFLFLVG